MALTLAVLAAVIIFNKFRVEKLGLAPIRLGNKVTACCQAQQCLSSLLCCSVWQAMLLVDLPGSGALQGPHLLAAHEVGAQLAVYANLLTCIVATPGHPC